MHQHTSRQHGYSLMELLIYIALFALLSIVLVRSLVTVMRTYASAQRYRALQNNGELVMERITRELRSGSVVITSACMTDPGTISIASVDAGGTSHTNVFAVTSGILRLTTDGVANAISSNEVSVTTFTACSFNTPVSTGVRVQVGLATTGANRATAMFYSTILLRGQ